MSRKNWKGLERKVASDFNTIRVLRKGESVPDVEIGSLLYKKEKIPFIIVECKNWASSSASKISEWMKQAFSYKKIKDQISVVVFKENGKKKTHVFIAINDLIKMTQNISVKGVVVDLDYEDFRNIVYNKLFEKQAGKKK